MDSKQLTGIIKEIGRGKNAARDLSRDDARALFTAILNDEIPPLQLGAVLIAMRIKGESLDELAGFLEACEATYPHLKAPAGTVPLVIPSYNGARQLPNLTPLLASLVAREGIPVLVHGVPDDPGRVTTIEVFQAMGVEPAGSIAEAEEQLVSRKLAVITIDTLSPKLARVLKLRRDIGLRSSGHTLVKILQPFTTKAVRLVSVTHPEYLDRMRAFFTCYASHALLLRGAEGEAVAHPRREPVIEWLNGKTVEVWRGTADENPELPDGRDAAVTAAWIGEVIVENRAAPTAITHQVECCMRATTIAPTENRGIENSYHT
ncbi:MAG: DNA-binding protein YbiB [Burkholderiales bacterium]|nr:DNA-binding protein YbiB [Burkholderiales bacterium]